MALNDKTINFDINKRNIFNLTAKQYDTDGARSFTFRLLKNSIPFDLEGLSVKVGGNKSDGKNIFNDCVVKDAKKGIVELELTTQMQVVAGTLNLELIIFREQTRLSTIPFEIQIIQSATCYAEIESSDEFKALQDALDTVQEIGNKADKTTTNELQKQIDNLVLGAVGDGNNAEVVQARGEHSTLNNRLEAISKGKEIEINAINDANINKVQINKLTDKILTTSDFTGSPFANEFIENEYICVTPKDNRQFGIITKNNLDYLFDILSYGSKLEISFEYKANVSIGIFMTNVANWNQYGSFVASNEFKKVSISFVPDEQFYKNEKKKEMFICSNPGSSISSDTSKIAIRNLSIRIENSEKPEILKKYDKENHDKLIEEVSNGDFLKNERVINDKIKSINIYKLDNTVSTTIDCKASEKGNASYNLIEDELIIVANADGGQFGLETQSFKNNSAMLNGGQFTIEFETKSDKEIAIYASVSESINWTPLSNSIAASSEYISHKYTFNLPSTFQDVNKPIIYICTQPGSESTSVIEGQTTLRFRNFKIYTDLKSKALEDRLSIHKTEVLKEIPIYRNGFNTINQDENKVKSSFPNLKPYFSTDKSKDTFGSQDENINNSIYPEILGWNLEVLGGNSGSIETHYEDKSLICKFKDLSKASLDGSQKYRLGNIIKNNISKIGNKITILLDYELEIEDFEYYKNNFVFYFQPRDSAGKIGYENILVPGEAGIIKFELDLSNYTLPLKSINFGVVYKSTIEPLSQEDVAIFKFKKMAVINGSSNITDFNDLLINEMNKTQVNEIEHIKNDINSLKDYNYLMMFKKIGGIGDSLMSGEHAYDDGTSHYIDRYDFSWLSYLTKQSYSDKVHYSNGGLTAKSWLESRHKTALENEEVKCNAYFIGLCTNDYNRKPYELGDINDVAGTDTFVGYYKQIIEFVHSVAQKAKIFIMSAYTLSDIAITYSNMINQIASLYDYCYFVDLINKSDILLNRDKEFYSLGHFNTLGYIKIAKNIERITNEVILENIKDFAMFGLND